MNGEYYKPVCRDSDVSEGTIAGSDRRGGNATRLRKPQPHYAVNLDYAGVFAGLRGILVLRPTQQRLA